jgi:hypothetical protein
MNLIRTVGVLSAVVLAGSLTLGAGCSSSTSGGGGTADSGPGTKDTGSVATDTGAGTKDTGTTPADTSAGDDTTGSQDQGDAALVECTAPASTASYTPATYVPAVAHQGVCSATQISAFVTACGYSMGATQMTCNAWQAANAGDAGNACGGCIANPSNNGGLWLDPYYKAMNNIFYGQPNYGACIQLLDPTNGTACAKALDADQACNGVACDAACMTATDPNGFQTCVMAATGCNSYATTEMTACATDISADGGGVGNTSCQPSAASGDQDDDLNFIIGLICGSATTDAGDQ